MKHPLSMDDIVGQLDYETLKQLRVIVLAELANRERFIAPIDVDGTEQPTDP